MEEELLKEYVSTYLNPKYNSDWDVVNSKFPELSGVDKGLLKEYVATYLNPKYNSDWDVVNSKFPELFPVGQTAAEQPIAEPVKKKDTVSPFVDGGSELTKFDPRTGQIVQQTTEFTKPREKDFSGLAVEVDEKLLTKKPTEAKPMVSGESTKVVSPKILQKEEVSTELDKKLEQFQASQKKGGNSYLENIAVNLGLGAAYANEAVLSIPESVINLLAIPQNYIAEKTGLPIGVTAEGIKESWGITNPLLDYAKESKKILSGEVSKYIADKYEDPSIVGNFEKGNYQDGFELLGSAITQSVPVSIGLMIGGAYTAPAKLATVATLGFTEAQREELGEIDPTMSEAEKTLKAAGMAAAESVFSSIGTATIGKVYRDIAKREGAEAAKGIFKDGLVQTYKKALEKTGVVAGFVGEGIEEAATQITQNVISGRPAFEGVADAFVTGAGSGVVFTAPISAINAKRYIDNKITSYDTKTKVTDILKDKADNIGQVYNVPISSEISTAQLDIANLPNSRNLLVNDLKKSVSKGDITEEDAKQSMFVFDKVQQVSNSVKDLNISNEDKATVATLLRQRDDLRTKIQNKDDVLVVQEKKQIEDINNQIQKILLTPQQDAIQEQAAGQVPVQPGATVSQEVAQGEPQAEPQGTAQEGIQEEINEENIILSGLSDGFKAVTRNSFDLRSDKEVMENISSRKSFTTSVTKNGKKYVVVGLRLNQDAGATTSGRDGYSFAAIEDNGSLPDNTVDVLTKKATSNISSIYPKIKNPTIDLFRPIEGQLVAQEEVTTKIPETKTTSDFADELSVKYGVELELQENQTDKSISVPKIVVPKDQRNKGVGTKVMEEVVAYADKEGKRLILTPSTSFGGTSVKRLVDFYKSIGFVENKGKNKDFTIRDSMYRNPVSPTQEVDFTEEEVAELEKAVSRNLPEYFQLATKKESPEKMAVLTDAATKLMDEVQPEIVEQSDVVSEPSMETIPITVTENVELANKVPKMSVNDLVGKKVNYVMADQLKVDDELMGGPFFPLMDDTFGKVAWASMDVESAKKIIRGFIKGDYSVVYNMSPSAVDSNIATLNEFVKRLNSIPASENIYPQVAEYLKGRKFGKDTKAIQDVVNKSSNLESFINGFKSLNVDQRQEIIKAVLPSKSVKATTKLGSTLQKNNITQESVREAISEQFARNLPMGAMTMVLEITDAEGNPIRSEADIDKAIMTRDQQTAEGIRTHKNYPVYIRGRAVAMLEDTVPVWNVSSRALDTMNKKSAGIIQKKVPQAVDKEAPVKRGVPELFELTPELAAIGTAKDYSDYLDTIFPDSQIKNVAYHDSNSPNIEKFRNDINGIWTTGDPNWWQKGEYKYRVLLDVKSPNIIREPLNSSFAIDFFADKKNDKFDSYITTGLSGNLEEGVYVLRDSDQTHILGSKKDLNDFKKFVSAKPTETRKQSAAEIRADEMYTLQRSASRAEVISRPINTQYQSFVNRLSKAMPSVEIVSSQAEFDNLLNDLNAKKLATKNQKIYGAVLNGKLYLNPGLENFNTPVHEFGHVWMNAAKELSPEIYNKGIDLINNSEYVSQVEENPEYRRVTTRMKEDGMTDEQIRQYILEEALATAIGDKGESFVSASQKKNFKNWLNQLFEFIKKMTGISKLTPEQIQNLDLDQFLNGVVVDLLSENPIFKNAEIKTLSKQLQLMAMPDLSADDIVKIGLANGFSTGSIRELLNRRGFTEQAINEALAKDTPAAKKVEVTEELAPGYDRMIAELEGVVQKSLNRGTTQVRAMENAINYLQGTKVYENATDVQREQMVRDVNKRFKKREKRAPTAEKVVGKPKKKGVTVDEMAALKDQIKLEARAAREAKGDLNDKRKALAAKVSALKGKGTVTTNQIDTIVKKIESTNLDNPIMVDRLLAYIEKVFDNANYAADMTELRKLQRQARTKKHTSMKDFVDRFTYINPEIIPLDRIQDYKEALDFLNNLTPSYARMNEMLPEIESYQVSEEFDAAKTMDSLMSKYENIALNQVGSVEDYVNLIKDINSFKRKAFQLLQNEAIIQKDYDDLINMVGKDQAAVEKRYEKEIAQRKKDLIAEIKKQRPKTNPEFTKEENDLIREYLELSDADLQSLSPEDLFVLNDLLENVSNGEIDYYRFKNVVSKAANNKAGVEVGKQLKGSKLSLGSAELRKKMAQFESSFWEGLLGLGRATSGPLQKFIISPFNRAIGSYEKFLRDGYNDFLKLKKKYKIDDKGMNKIGMLTTYLQEYMAQFDPNNKGVKDIGKRDWFKEILDTETMRDDYSPKELKIIEEIHKSLPKDKDGNVDPKALYDSYIANDGKFFTKNEKGFFDAVMEWKKNNSTSKQKAANEMSGNAFNEIPFHMLRSRYSGQTSQITPSTSGDNGMVRIKAGTGKERASEAVGAINTNFEKLFIKGLEQTGRDYFLSKTLKDINNVLSSAKKELNGDKDPLVKAISYTLSDALAYEFSDTASQNILKRLVQARAAMTLFDPIRAGVEFTSTLLSFGLRARTLSGYKNLFGSQGEMRNLLEFTDSPLRLRQNINNAIDINDGRIEPQGMLMKWTTFLSGLPERTMMVTSWMPTFTNEFQNITKEKFDMKKFNDSEAYREKYGKAIKEASAVADAQTEKIIGPTTKAGQRRDIVIAPGKTVGRDTVSGQILGFFSNYPYREITEFVNGFREAGEVLKKGDTVEAISQLQKPLGIALNVATYGFLSSVVYASRLILLGDEDEEERGNKLLEELMTAKGFIEETAANAAALAASKYAGGGRAILQVLGTLGMMLTDNEETKATIKKMLKGSVYVDPLPTQKLSGYGTADKVNTAILKYIPQFVVLSNIIIDTIGLGNELKAIIDTVEKKGVEALTEDEKLKVLALSVVFTGTQLLLNYRGTSLPSYNNLKAGMKKVKEEAGVADISAGKVPAKKKSSGGSSRGGGMNKTDMKKYNPELYNQMYGPGSAGYEVEQQVKEFEKEQREFKKKMKDQLFGGG
jgi:GNAT superfamily N-acetyltransferase